MALKTLFRKFIEKIKCKCKSSCCTKIVEIDIKNVKNNVYL